MRMRARGSAIAGPFVMPSSRWRQWVVDFKRGLEVAVSQRALSSLLVFGVESPDRDFRRCTKVDGHLPQPIDDALLVGMALPEQQVVVAALSPMEPPPKTRLRPAF